MGTGASCPLPSSIPQDYLMRIALVVHDFTESLGHGRYTVELARRFRRDHEVHVFSNTANPATMDGVQRHHVPAYRANALSTILSFPLPASAMVGRAFDIVHAQGACALHFNVLTAHICNAAWAQAQRAARVARTWRQRVFERIVTPIERATFRRAHPEGIIAISAQLRRELTEFYGTPDDVRVIHHGVDTAAFSPATRNALRPAVRAELQMGEADVGVLFVGDLRKGAAVAMDVVAQTPGVRLLLVSRSDPAPYHAHAARLNIAERVRFLGPTNRIERYYAAADVLLFPSPYDAFGMVITEAMAMGLPVITTRRAGASEVIVDGASGFTVERPDAPEPMAACLLRLSRDASLRERIGRAARQAAEGHSWDEVASQTMAVYERVLGKAPSA